MLLKSPIICTCVLVVIVLCETEHRKVIKSHIVLVKDAALLAIKRDLDPLPYYLTYDLTLPDGNSIKLTLTKRSELSPADFRIKFHNPELDELEYTSLENVGFYHDPSTQAVLSITADGDQHPYKRTLTGTFVHDDKAFEITPIFEDETDVTAFLKSRGIDSTKAHLLHILTEVKLPSHDEHERHTSSSDSETYDTDDDIYDGESESETKKDKLEMLMARLLRDKVRVKRMTSYYQEDFNVEIVFLVDFSIYKYWLAKNSGSHKRAVYDIQFFFSHIFHGMYMAYNSIPYDTYRIRITLWLKEIRICTTSEEAKMVEHAKMTDTKFNLDLSEDMLREYMDEHGFTWANPDHLMLWSRYTLVMGNKEGLLGLAGDICSVCTMGQGLSQNHEFGLYSWTTGAHELAHTLGAQHDKKSYGCPASDQYIMTSFSMELDEEKYKNAFTFSWCSVQMMKMCFLGRPYGGVSPVFPRACVYDTVCQHGHPIEDDLTKLPGQMYNLREQCQIAMGEERATYDPNCNSGRDICKSMRCRLDNHCTDKGIRELRAAAGSPCGQSGMICFKGDCVDKNSIKYVLDDSTKSCTIINKVPKGCRDNQQFIHDDELTCEDIPRRKPWMCFYNNDIKQNCRASCFKWGLVRAKQPLCNFVEVEQETPQIDIVQADSETGYFTKMKFTYCGYQYQRWWVTCPGDPGQCIPMRYACNGVDDCPNGEDEKRDWCFKVPSGESGMVRCPGEPTILITEDSLCDGKPDCPGGRDEEKAKCDHYTYCDKSGTEASCPNNPKKCVPLSFTCDGREDCGEDELAGDENPEFCASLCQPGKVRCPKMQTAADCIFGQWACDGRDDCGDNSDEDPQWCESLKKLPPRCPGGKDSCPTAPYICIDKGYFCDGVKDCPENEDEEQCPGTREMNSLKRLNRLVKEVYDESERKQTKINMERGRQNLKPIDRKLYEMVLEEQMYRSHLAKAVEE